MLEGRHSGPGQANRRLQDKDRFPRSLGEGLNSKTMRKTWRVACHRVSQHLRGVSSDTLPQGGREKPGQKISFIQEKWSNKHSQKIMNHYAAASSLQSCPTLCNPTDGSPPGSPVPGILLARTLEWVAISFSSAWKWKVKVKSLSCVWLWATPWTAAR